MIDLQSVYLSLWKSIKAYKAVLLAIILFKLILALVFSSPLQNEIYIPFFTQFLNGLQNPWDYSYDHNQDIHFPYPPLLLYIYSAALIPYVFFFQPVHWLGNLLIKLPSLMADISIFILLVKLFPDKVKRIIIFYFCSPIVLYNCYMYAHLDLVPIALLTLSIFLLVRERVLASAIVLGCAMGAKAPTVAVFPIAAIYVFKNFPLKKGFSFFITPWIVYLGIILPYISSTGYQSEVLHNKEQLQLFSLVIKSGELNIYIIPMVILMFYVKFLLYNKINRDLFFSFIGLIFSIFSLFIPPTPNWFLWMIPFHTIFLISLDGRNKNLLMLHGAFLMSYFVYFIFFFHGNSFYPADLYNLEIFSKGFHFRIENAVLENLSYTILESMLAIKIFVMYKHGVKSNSIYQPSKWPIVLGIAGDSGSGKTVLSNDLNKTFGKNSITLIEGDGAHRWERADDHWKEFTHLNPKANFLYKQSEDILNLKLGKSVERPEYDHDTGALTSPRKMEPKDYILVCGLHAFYLPKARKVIDIKIYMDIAEDLRHYWKIRRDMKERGHKLTQILDQIKDRLQDSRKYVIPQKNFADIIIRYFSSNPVDPNDLKSEPKIHLQIVMDSNIFLDHILETLKAGHVSFQHDYAEDLKTQFITLEHPPSRKVIQELAKTRIVNMYELVKGEIWWEEGFRGFVQFMILIAISEHLKSEF